MGLPQDIESCHQMIKGLLVTVEQLMLRVKELDAQINQNSRNSSRPPSSDLHRKGAAFPRTKGGKIGGKKRA